MSDFDEIKRISKVYDNRANVASGVKAAGQWGSDELAKMITEEIIKKINVKKTDSILEIGCGSGVLGSVLKKHCMNYCGFDASKLMLKKFQEEHSLQNFNLFEASANLIPFKNNSFDIIVLNGVSMYFPNEKFLLSVLSEIKKICKHDGKIFIGENIVPSKYHWELVWYENLNSSLQGIARQYIKFRRWAAKKNLFLAGKWKNAHNDISPKTVKSFFQEAEFQISDSAAYTIRKKKFGKSVKGNRRIDFLINMGRR